MKVYVLVICLLVAAVSLAHAKPEPRPCPRYACIVPGCSDPIYTGGKCPSCPKCPGKECPAIACLVSECTEDKDCAYPGDICCGGCCVPRNFGF